jgi:molybdopterin-guanine dinucleotide biosynthesis protein
MRPVIIGIGGAHRGAGKTTYASLILKRLKGWGAVKYTKTSLYCSIIDDIEILSEEGKDTKRLLDSGAEKVLWVQSPYDNLTETLHMAVESLLYLKGIIVEGNSAIEVLKPDIVIYISETDIGRFKKGAYEVLKISDVVIFDKEPPQGTPEGAKRFHMDDVEGCINFVTGLIKKCEDRG